MRIKNEGDFLCYITIVSLHSHQNFVFNLLAKNDIRDHTRDAIGDGVKVVAIGQGLLEGLVAQRHRDALERFVVEKTQGGARMAKHMSMRVDPNRVEANLQQP